MVICCLTPLRLLKEILNLNNMAKKNIRKVPKIILDRVQAFDQDDIIVACTKAIKPEDVRKYSHLGLSIENGILKLPAETVPSPAAGRFSNANVYGREKKRTDLPKISKTFSHEVPSWNGYGTHTVSREMDVYVVDFYPPKEVTLSAALVEEKNGSYIVKFAIEQVISKRTDNFEQELFYNLNILQENVGAMNVFLSSMSLEEYSNTVSVAWEILPPGTVDEVVRGMISGTTRITEEQETVMFERINLMNDLEPEYYIKGSDGFLKYFGAKFGDNLVAFENVNYGNAMYIMFDDWENLSQKSRVELLSGHRDSFKRIIHKSGWEDEFTKVVEEYKNDIHESNA